MNKSVVSNNNKGVQSESDTYSEWTGSSTMSSLKFGAPNLDVGLGDKKYTYHLADGGKLIKLEKANGDVTYALRCVDGRRVLLERTPLNANLSLTDANGKIRKTLAAEY